MSIIGEALLSAAINTLVDKLASTDLLQFARQEQILADIEKWKKKLGKIEAVLDDAEEKQTANGLVEIWLGELQKLAYDVEDMIDEFVTEALRRKLLDEPQASTSKVRKLIPTCCTDLNPRSLKLNSTMASQIKEITTRLQQIVEDKNSFDLKESSGTMSNRARYQRPPATHLNDPHIYGRDHDKEAILELLLKDDGADAKFSVVSIEGFGGLGKTTLAQLAYNDARVKDHFDIKAWVCVSEDFDVVRITKTILQSATDGDLSMLHDKLKEKLSGKKFCIVLDDVWTENYEKWTILCRPFEVCSFGSKIVVTTRNHSVSSKVGASPAYQLEALSNEDCLSIFTHHSLGKVDFNEHQDLKEIGDKIVKRCKGVPLAAKTLGGLLRGKVNSKDWKDVLDSNLWNLSEEESGIIPALRVSYYYLPSHLKRCFAYCSLFPKGYVFHKEELILLWMAEGFLQTKSSRKQAEDLGEDYFDDLHSRSFFQQIRNDDGFVMHDLINDLAQWTGKDFCCRIDTLQEGENQWKIPENIRHLCFLNDGSIDEFIRKSGALNEMKSVRTLLTLSSTSKIQRLRVLSEIQRFRFFKSYEFPCMVLQLQRLRVLSLQTYRIKELPKQIGDLKLLHHLDLSYSLIKFLPDSVNRLYNLETLILKDCCWLKRLCLDMGNLIKLRHLCFSYAYKLEGMPLRIGQLTSLRTLAVFVVGKNMGSGLRELKDLMDLRERLDISGLENVNDSEDAEKANLRGKGGLKDLQLKWTHSSDGSNEKEIAAQVLEKLQPCQKLERLHILGYGGTRFPQWLGDTSLSGLVSLTIQDCKNCTFLPSIGQLPSLKKLSISGCDSLTCIARVQLPLNLKRLHIEHCSNLLTVLEEEQVSGSCMNTPSLEYLKIENCPSLTCVWSKSNELPDTLGKIKLSRCSNLATLTSRGNLPKALRYLSITHCSKLVSIAKTFHDNMKLEKLYIDDCEKLETLPISINNLLSLRKLIICNCPGMVSIPVGGFLTKVTFLDINGVGICKSLLEWGLHRLTSLEVLEIGGCPDVMSFPQEETQMILPNSLTTLVIHDFPNLERLSSIVQNLACLEKLRLSDCPKLEYFPENGLPKSLKQLEISGCPLLEERCKKGEGVYWPMICHLFGNVFVYTSEEEEDDDDD